MQVDFDDGYAIEGAKEVSTVMTRHVSRMLRPWLAQQAEPDRLTARRRQATDQFRQYWVSAVQQGSRMLQHSAMAREPAGGESIGTGASGSRTQAEVPEQTLYLRVSDDQRRLMLEHQPKGEP